MTRCPRPGMVRNESSWRDASPVRGSVGGWSGCKVKKVWGLTKILIEVWKSEGRKEWEGDGFGNDQLHGKGMVLGMERK